VLVLLCAVPATADATMPGANGKIAFHNFGTNGCESTSDIYTINPDGTDQANLTNSPTFEAEPAWSPDGERIAFARRSTPSTCTGSLDLYVMDDDGSNRGGPLSSVTALNTAPSWSPDGERIAFQAIPSFGECPPDQEIYTVTASGTGQARVTDNLDYDDVAPDWSPDGGRFAFGRDPIFVFDPDFCEWGDGSNEVWTMSTDGSDQTRLAPEVNAYGYPTFSWSPDGRKVAFDAFPPVNAAKGEIYVMDADGSNVVNLTNDPAVDIMPAWSPDGRKIAFTSSRAADGNHDIYTMNSDGSDVTRVTSNTGGDVAASWQPLTGSYPRPKGATPVLVSLVPAYEHCTAANSTHGAPLASPSCNPPDQASDELTTGIGDFQPPPAKWRGQLRLDVAAGDPGTPADEADVAIRFNLQDVRNQPDFSDYDGELDLRLSLRITDRYNGYGAGSATASDLAFPITVPCTTTADTTVGSSCSLTTLADGGVLPGAIPESKRSIWELGAVDVFDGGPDGVAATAPNTRFATQGIFVP
jgi:Tol biopolymer transport system component